MLKFVWLVRIVSPSWKGETHAASGQIDQAATHLSGDRGRAGSRVRPGLWSVAGDGRPSTGIAGGPRQLDDGECGHPAGFGVGAALGVVVAEMTAVVERTAVEMAAAVTASVAMRASVMAATTAVITIGGLR